jgi:hypothetical protein
MIERSDDTRFLVEALAEACLGKFDRDDTIYSRIASLPYLAHASGRDARH